MNICRPSLRPLARRRLGLPPRPLCACVLLLALFTSSRAACAQDTTGALLSLDDCIRFALQKNERLVSAGYGVGAAEARRKEVGAARLPNANLRAGASYAPVTGLDPVLTEGGEYAALVDIDQKLYDRALHLERRQADVGILQARQEQTRTTADLRLDVRLAYLDLLYAQRRRTITEQSIRDLDSYLGTVRALASAGEVPKTDVMKVEIQLQTEAVQLDDLLAAVQAGRLHLLEAIGLPLDGAIAIEDTFDLPQPPPGLDAAVNPELRQAELGVRASELGLQTAHAGRQPVLGFEGSVGAWTSRTQLLETDAPDVVGYLAGVSLEMPVWNWGATSARVHQRTAELNAARAEYRLLQRRLDAEYRDDRVRYETARGKLSRLEENLRRALEQYGLIVSLYAGGGSSSLEVLDAHRSLLEVAVQRQETRAEAGRLQAEMLHLAGAEP
jgi:outer membrane protein TolC